MRLGLCLDLNDPGFRAIARLIPPLLLGSALGNANTLVDRAVGSMVGEGTISALSYAWRLIGLGETLLVASLLTALYPAFGAAAGARNHDEMRRLIGRGLATVATVLFPVCAFLLVCARPLVTIVFEHGSFGSSDAERTATAVLWYAPALLALGWRELVVRASYALGDSRWPVLVTLLAMAVNVVGDFTLGLAFGIAGLAASTSLSLVLAAVANTWFLGRHHGVVGLGQCPGWWRGRPWPLWLGRSWEPWCCGSWLRSSNPVSAVTRYRARRLDWPCSAASLGRCTSSVPRSADCWPRPWRR